MGSDFRGDPDPGWRGTPGGESDTAPTIVDLIAILRKNREIQTDEQLRIPGFDHRKSILKRRKTTFPSPHLVLHISDPVQGTADRDMFQPDRCPDFLKPPHSQVRVDQIGQDEYFGLTIFCPENPHNIDEVFSQPRLAAAQYDEPYVIQQAGAIHHSFNVVR
jgi:hypothetical protein